MAAERVVKARFSAHAKARPTCTWSPEFVVRLVGCGVAAATAFAVALGISCSGPLPDTCAELGTCVPPLVALARLDAGTDASADVGAAADVGAPVDIGASADVVKACDSTRDPKDDPCVIDSAYGVFVAPPVNVDAGQDGGDVAPAMGDGSASRPYETIGQALTNLGQKTRIYVCGGIYREQVNITSAVSVYGGLSCAPGASGRTWTYTGAVAQVSSPSPAYALSVSGVSSGAVAIEDVSFASPDATSPGGSSIAALAFGSSVNLVRVALSAGSGVNGARGADGTANPNYMGPAPDGGAQVSTTISGLFSPVSGGAGAVNQCLLFGSSAGGKGGLGCASAAGVQGGAGTAGTATPEPPVVATGRDGLPMGASTVGDGGSPTVTTTNDPGADGVAGNGGVAAAPQVFGALSASGWTPTAAGDGAPGGPGQGGAGASDPLYGQCNVAQPSLGGGGGGAGGCGGAGGKGASGGGASIALASVGSIVNLMSCSLTTSAAGTGGAGGAGEEGQAGGVGGDVGGASQLHAAGAPGGNGAGGSGGAGGTGGISVGVLASGSTITMDGPTGQNTRLGAPGAGGAAGPGGGHGSGGALTTGVDGNSGASGSAGTSVALLKLM